MDQSMLSVSPPRGKKRRLQENERRLGPIYATDAFSFLGHFWLKRCRLVSSYYDRLISEAKIKGRLQPREDFDTFLLSQSVDYN